MHIRGLTSVACWRGGHRVKANHKMKKTCFFDNYVIMMYLYKHNVCYIFSSVATSKQGDSLEDFKKIAERNGITVCPAGNFKFKAHHSVQQKKLRPLQSHY